MVDAEDSRVWFVTGCSTGIGRALAELLAARGERAVITARDADTITDIAADKGDSVLALQLDVVDSVRVETAVGQALTRFGRIDVLVNNAGVGLVGAIEECGPEDVRRVYDTNVFGTLNVTRAVLPGMRSARRGRILALSSVGGFRAKGSVGIYNSSKFALEGLMEALAAEVAPLGISVTILELGLFKTDFRHRSIARAARVIADYDGTVGKIRAGLETEYPESAGEPQQAAEAILALVDSGRPAPMRLPLGADAYEAVLEELGDVRAELEQWEAFSRRYGGGAEAMAMYDGLAAAGRNAHGGD